MAEEARVWGPEVRQDVEVRTVTSMVTICHGMGTLGYKSFLRAKCQKILGLLKGSVSALMFNFTAFCFLAILSFPCVEIFEWDISLFRPDFSRRLARQCFICAGHRGRGGDGGGGGGGMPEYALNLTTYLLQLNTPCTPSQAPERLMAAGHWTMGKQQITKMMVPWCHLSRETQK